MPAIGDCHSDISESWASGSVTARLSEPCDMSISAGGLAGYIENGSIQNCYALGTVLADNPHASAASPRAGGLVGELKSTDLSYCFAKGSVTAQTAGSGAAYAGGIVGYRTGTNMLTNTAALGISVIAKGSATPTVGRIYAYSATALPSGSVNYGTFNPSNPPDAANEDGGMTLYKAASYSELGTSDSATSLADGKDGLRVGPRILRYDNVAGVKDPVFWTNATDASTKGIAFDSVVWNADSSPTTGYPKLRNNP